MQITIPARTMTLDEQFVKDVFTTAVEGGIDYWAVLTDVVRDDELNVLSIEGEDIEDPETEFQCDLGVVALGIQKVVTEDHKMVKYILEGDSGMIDADDADVILQLGIFGEVVYG